MTATAEMLAQAGQDDVSRARAPDPAVTRLEPVKRLMLAVLECAVNDLRTYASVPTARGRRLFAEVDAWFRSSANGPFDFETICQATGLDPDFVRKGLGCTSRRRRLGEARAAARGAGGSGRHVPVAERQR